MSALALEATKRIANLDDDNIKLVINYINTLSPATKKQSKVVFGLAKNIPRITQEEFDSCNDEIRAMFEDGDI